MSSLLTEKKNIKEAIIYIPQFCVLFVKKNIPRLLFQNIPFDNPSPSCVPVGEEDKNRFANVLPRNTIITLFFRLNLVWFCLHFFDDLLVPSWNLLIREYISGSATVVPFKRRHYFLVRRVRKSNIRTLTYGSLLYCSEPQLNRPTHRVCISLMSFKLPPLHSLVNLFQTSRY